MQDFKDVGAHEGQTVNSNVDGSFVEVVDVCDVTRGYDVLKPRSCNEVEAVDCEPPGEGFGESCIPASKVSNDYSLLFLKPVLQALCDPCYRIMLVRPLLGLLSKAIVVLGEEVGVLLKLPEGLRAWLGVKRLI